LSLLPFPYHLHCHSSTLFFFSSMLHQQPSPTLFPYTTLFRSIPNIKEPVAIGVAFSHSFRSRPFPLKILHLIWRFISPGIVCVFESAAARLFPLGFCGQPECFAY